MLVLTPTQAAAFWCLRMLNADDLSRLAMAWLEGGATSHNAAVLASERNVTLRDHAALFEAVLKDMGASTLGAKRATWVVIQTLLRAVESGDLGVLDAAQIIVAMQREGFELFPARCLAPGGQSFAGEELGIEKILGLYYDDCDLSDADAEARAGELKAECARVLGAWYTIAPEFNDEVEP